MGVVTAGEAFKGAILEGNTILKREHSSSVFCASLICCSRFGLAGRQEVIRVEKASTSSTSSLSSSSVRPTGAHESVSATLSYIRGTSETIARILQPYNIRVAHKPITSLRRRRLTNVKDKDKPEDRQEAVYKIKCCDCQASYIGETGRNLST